MDARIDQVVAGHYGLVAHAITGRTGEGAEEDVFRPGLVDLASGVERHRLPGRAAVVGGKPVERAAARDVHLSIDLCGLDPLRQLILPRDIGAIGVVQVANEIHILVVQGG